MTDEGPDTIMPGQDPIGFTGLGVLFLGLVHLDFHKLEHEY